MERQSSMQHVFNNMKSQWKSSFVEEINNQFQMEMQVFS